MSCNSTGTSFMFGNGLFTPEMAHVVDNVNCTGKESKITDCPHIIKNSLQPYKAIILNCPRGELPHRMLVFSWGIAPNAGVIMQLKIGS